MDIKLKNLTKKYSEFTAVDNINITIEDKKITVFIGPSGCGKTTTMKMLNKLIKRTSGDIIFGKKSIDDINPINLRRNIGYVIQEIGLFPHMTIYENIAVVPRLLKWNEKKISERVDELLDLVNLDPKTNRDKYPIELSGGQRQRVGVARGLAADPDVILMDEPFGAIDPINRESLQDAFLEIQEKIQKTIVFVTHDIREAIKLGDRIAVLNKGKIIQYDEPIEIIKNPKNEFVQELLGDDSQFKALEFIKAKEIVENNATVIDFSLSEDKKDKIIKDSSSKIIVLKDKNKFKGYFSKSTYLSGKKIKLKTEYTKDRNNLLEVLNKMMQFGITRIPVVNREKEVIGTISFKNIFNSFNADD